MNELHKEKLKIFANDRPLLEAVRFAFMESIAKERPLIEDEHDNKLLGERFRAYEVAKIFVDEAFKIIDSYKEENKNKKNFQKER